MSAELTAMQLVGAYLRYLPFRREMSSTQIATLWKRFFLWSSFDVTINIFFISAGVTFQTYKFALFVLWIPYAILALTVIRGKLFQHVFVFGMESLWVFMLHSVAGMITAATFGAVNENVLTFLELVALILFAILITFETNFFTNLFPSQEFFEDKSLRLITSIFPTVIFIGTAIPIVNVTYLTTWQDRFSRIIIPLFFLIMYRSMNISAQQYEEKIQRQQKLRLMRQQLLSLKEHTALMQSSNLEVEKLREDLNKSYDVIDGLIYDGKFSAAMQYIKEQDSLLDKTVVKKFCDAPLINAAVSIYFSRARELGVKFYHKINLPAEFSTDENDLALLLSNLLENAVQASAKQKNNRREISLIVQHNDEQFILEISNRFDAKIKIGKNNLPVAEIEGHGLGMMSLESFAKKYDAYVDFSQINGKVQFSIYWQENFSPFTDEQANAYTLP